MKELGENENLHEAQGSFRPAALLLRIPWAIFIPLGFSLGMGTPGQGGDVCAFCQIGG